MFAPACHVVKQRSEKKVFIMAGLPERFTRDSLSMVQGLNQENKTIPYSSMHSFSIQMRPQNSALRWRGFSETRLLLRFSRASQSTVANQTKGTS